VALPANVSLWLPQAKPGPGQKRKLLTALGSNGGL